MSYGVSNFRAGYQSQGSVLGPAVVKNVSLTADNQFIDVQGFPLVLLISDATTASSRTFTLSAGNFVGHRLNIILESGSSTTCELANSGNCKLSGAWAPVQYQGIELYFDGTYWIEVGRTPSTAAVELTGALTQAQILTLNSVPVTLLAAAAAGTAYVVDEVEVFHSYSTTVYAAGGDLTLTYDAAGSAIVDFDSTLITAASSYHGVSKPSVYNLDASTGTAKSGFDLANATAKALVLQAASADFTGGNAANVFKYRIRYRTITVLT